MADTLHQSTDPQTPEELYRLYRTLSEQLREQLAQIENDKHELEVQMMERVGNLESRNLELREQLRQVEADKRYIETQKIRYEREVRKLKSESEQLRSPPLIIGTITVGLDGPQGLNCEDAFSAERPGSGFARRKPSARRADHVPGAARIR